MTRYLLIPGVILGFGGALLFMSAAALSKAPSLPQLRIFLSIALVGMFLSMVYLFIEIWSK